MTTATVPTIADLIEFVYDNPNTTPFAVGQEFNITTTDAEELLSSLDNDDGTLCFDGDAGYNVEDKDDTLEDILTRHMMGGGRKLNEELPIIQPKAKKKKAAKKATTKKKTSKKKTTKKPAKKAKKKKASKKTEGNEEATEQAKKPAKKTVKKKTEPKSEDKENKEDKPTKTRTVKPRASRIVEDESEAKNLGVDVGTEVKTCVDCRNVYAKFGGMFRPRWRNPEAVNKVNPDAKAHKKHVQPRCIDCDKKRSRRKSRFTGLQRAVGLEDIGDPKVLISHPDRKSGGVPDGKFSVALVDDTVDGFTPNLRGVLVSMAEGLIKLRWKSGSDPEIVGATKKAIAATKAPKVEAPKPAPAKPKKAKKKKATKKVKTEKEPKDSSEDTEEAPKPKKAKKKKAKKKTKAQKQAEEASERPW